MSKVVAREVMIYDEDFTQGSETASVQMKIMIDCDKLIERKGLWKVVYKKRGVSWKRARRGEKQGGESNFIAYAFFG